MNLEEILGCQSITWLTWGALMWLSSDPPLTAGHMLWAGVGAFLALLALQTIKRTLS